MVRHFSKVEGTVDSTPASLEDPRPVAQAAQRATGYNWPCLEIAVRIETSVDQDAWAAMARGVLGTGEGREGEGATSNVPNDGQVELLAEVWLR